jgi:hypothetical protein
MICFISAVHGVGDGNPLLAERLRDRLLGTAAGIGAGSLPIF